MKKRIVPVVVVLLLSAPAFGYSRSAALRHRFLRSLGLSRTPAHCQVDHWNPLHCGGTDTMGNLRLTCGAYEQAKEQAERDCATLPAWQAEHPCVTPECRASGQKGNRK